MESTVIFFDRVLLKHRCVKTNLEPYRTVKLFRDQA